MRANLGITPSNLNMGGRVVDGTGVRGLVTGQYNKAHHPACLIWPSQSFITPVRNSIYTHYYTDLHIISRPDYETKYITLIIQHTNNCSKIITWHKTYCKDLINPYDDPYRYRYLEFIPILIPDIDTLHEIPTNTDICHFKPIPEVIPMSIS